ncbi:DGQHR domain-containing protein [Aneurinibacillus terranovensis]|uniref:DGQHR domain-containing protein n=1 Tax=Aneurinibacillus terranovensis TaxID=278991 RepID=UPI0004258C1C|nr:DGQHR domain-containing protein [Aneurinibacillus terranovensis]
MIKINVLRSIQKDQVIYIGYLTKEQAEILTFSDCYPPTKSRLGYQRPPEKKRARAFADYIKDNGAGFLTPVLLNARQKVKFVCEEDTQYGYILVPEKNCFAIVDGQHRTLGVINYLEAELPIPFMLFDSLDTDAEQELFITINREQKKVSMSHVRFIGQKNDPFSELAVKLELDPKSPWYHRVNLVGARGTKRPVSLQSLRNALEELFQSGEMKALSFDEKYKVAVDFWMVVSKVWPEAWEAPKNSLLKKAIGTLAICKLGGYLIPQCFNRSIRKVDIQKLESFLVRASEVNWMSDGNFKGYSGRHGADLVKNELDLLIFSKVDIET